LQVVHVFIRKGTPDMRPSLKAAAAALAVVSFVVLGAADLSAGATPGATTPGDAGPAAGAPGAAAPAAAASTKAKLGMSAPDNLWAARVKDVGPGLQARRVFVNSFTGSLSVATQACNAGMYPVISFKPGSYSWSQVATGKADAALRSMATKLAALPCDVFVAIAHEPDGDGTPADWSSMQVHALPLLGPDLGVKVGVIGNGWWWSTTSKGLSDAELAAWIPRSVINVSDVIAGDTYQANATGEEPATKMASMAAWARRVAGVKAVGVGEFNAQTAQGITNATTELGSDPLFAWGCLWNAFGPGAANATVLTGDRLLAFRKVLAAW
jgi:hypothetical protein